MKTSGLLKNIDKMKHVIVSFLLFFAIGASIEIKAQDKIVLRNGRTIEVKVQRSLSERVEYTYPGETSVYERPKSVISYILYQDGRKEICDESLRTNERTSSAISNRSSSTRSRISEADEVYWQDVKTTFSEVDVRGMKRLSRISATSQISYKDAINKLKKKAAAIGGTTILIMDIPDNEDSEDVSVTGMAYRDEKMEYMPRSAAEKTSTPTESPSNTRRRTIAQQMERYNEPQTTMPERSTTSRNNSVKTGSDRQVYDNADSPDAVYLTNGRVIRGTIEEYEPDDFVSIRNASGKIYEFSMDDVKRVAWASSKTASSRSKTTARKTRGNEYEEEDFDSYAKTSARSYGNDYYDYSTSGYKGFFDAGFNMRLGGTGEKNNYEINTSHGYQLNEYIFIGAGVGLHMYNARDPNLKDSKSYPQYVGSLQSTGAIKPADSCTYIHAVDSSYMTLPLFIDVRGYLPLQNAAFKPYAMFRIGYAFNLSDKFGGMGLYLNPAIGLTYQLSPSVGLNFSIGYAYQSYGGIPKVGGYGYYYFNNSTEQAKGIKYEAKGAGGLSLKLGIEF